jgi:hypothetical protein
MLHLVVHRGVSYWHQSVLPIPGAVFSPECVTLGNAVEIYIFLWYVILELFSTLGFLTKQVEISKNN